MDEMFKDILFMVYGQIYKITNDVNGKFYIGQTKYGLKSRFHRHIVDSIGERHLDTHLARAIRKYGPEHFHIEEIDVANSKEELTQKEYFWIKKTDALHKGYNETIAEFRCGGNTYLSKTKKELNKIKEKISKSNGRGNNGNARRVKMLNVKTGEELFFDSIKSLQEHFNIKHHTDIARRCKHIIKKLFLDTWKISYADCDYDDKDVYVKKQTVHVGSRRISVFDSQNKTTVVYSSYRDFERKNNLKYKSVAVKTTYKKGDTFIFKNRYKITLLN